MKKTLALGLIFVLLLPLTLGGCTTETNGNTLTILNYGKYIDPDVLDLFEEETGIKVNYEEYQSPENMYTKYKSGSINYDLICTSDYMIEKLIAEGEVLPLDFDSLSNFSNLDETYFTYCQSFDPDNLYALPYFFGTVGLLYNKTMVTESDMTSWACLWNEAYSGKIIMAESVRDAFLPALKYLGYSINTTDESELLEAQQLLINQKSLVYSYLLDEAQDEMIAENAAIALVYSGEAAAAMMENENLAFSIPTEGSNMWIDCWFMPATCKNSENAQLFLDFLCREDIAAMNFEYVYYSTPNATLVASLDASLTANSVIFPTTDTLDHCEILKALSSDLTSLYSTMWKEIKSAN